VAPAMREMLSPTAAIIGQVGRSCGMGSFGLALSSPMGRFSGGNLIGLVDRLTLGLP